jgi:hypothetical protein
MSGATTLTTNSHNAGISLPQSILNRIDALKHPDIPRSRFVLRILEAALIEREVAKDY